MEVYVVGGAVRDLVLGREPKDYDYVVVGSTPAEMIAKGYKQVGADFPVFLHPATGEEYALARTERKNGIGYHGFDTIFTSDITLEDDLSRRDLTMNAMAHPIDGFNDDGRPYFDFHPSRVIDPFNGRGDIYDGYLRHVSDSFREDPVRLLRIARFAARYRFAVHPATMKMLQDMVKAEELKHLPPDRVWKEVSQGLMTDHPELFFDVLRRCNAMWDLEVFMGGASRVCGGLIEASITDVPLHIRFACIAEMFRTDAGMYEAHRIPRDCKEMALTLWHCLDVALCYKDYSYRDRVQWLTRMGGLGAKRNTSMFDDFVKAVRIIGPTKRLDNGWHDDLQTMITDRNMLVHEFLEPVIRSAKMGDNVGQIVEDHYVDVLDRFHRKYSN